MINPWEKFFQDKITRIFTEKKSVVDIGGGLRILQDRGNRYDPSHEWIIPLAKNVEYRILDPVPDYNPDIIGDIHHLPFKKNSQDAIVCIAVLEHVESPVRAMQEIFRVLKPGGYCFLYVPFLYYYHAEKGYYKNYWRFTEDSLQMLCKDFSSIEIQNVRGALSAWINISPLGKIKFFYILFNFLDVIFKKTNSHQTSGFNVFLVK